MVMTSTIFFFDVVSNKRQLSKDKTLLYHYTSDSTPDHFFMIQAPQTFRDMKFLQRERKLLAYSHAEPMARQKRSLELQPCLNHKTPLKGKDLLLQFPDLQQKQHHHRGYYKE